jgi:hypothetical protein
MINYQNPRDAWLYQLLVATAGHKHRPKLRELLSAILPYAVLFIVIEVMCAALIMYLAATKDDAAIQHGAAHPPASTHDSRPGLPH